VTTCPLHGCCERTERDFRKFARFFGEQGLAAGLRRLPVNWHDFEGLARRRLRKLRIRVPITTRRESPKGAHVVSSGKSTWLSDRRLRP
jgi:hypothetical protein